MRTARVFTSALILVAVSSTKAQQIQGTAQLSGTVVVSEASPEPVRRAIVTISGPGANGRSAITDDQGRFTIGGLPAGQFTLTATKPAYTKNAYGAKGPGRPGTMIALAAGQSMTGLRLI